ncbi:hypothetical protein OUZ56_005600 [Daphnia magna]|uniref:Uncharacterized protein n=1 Tax=Daphnia magna TaxID=35525 RepID=A0ABQ9YTB6_9CRUS|nr:hypothetical protein OUZ56_005600 [Daphnia magna]
MDEKQITDKRTLKLPPRPCLAPNLCLTNARRFQAVRCFRPARESRPARRSTPAGRFHKSVLLPALSTKIRKKKVKPNRRQFEPFSGGRPFSRQIKLREPSRTNGTTCTGTKGNNLLMVLERTQLSC